MKTQREIDQKVFLNGEWWALCKRFGVKDRLKIADTFTVLDNFYSVRNRFYHNWQHIVHCVLELNAVRNLNLCDNPDEVEFDLFLHDVIYDVTTNYSEKLSGELAWAIAEELGLGSEFGARAKNMILFTTHKVLPTQTDAKLLVDIDLSSLGSPPTEFDENTENIWLEYKSIPGITREKFDAGRAEFFKTMLDIRPNIYCTEYFRKKYEGQAIENLKRSLRKIQSLERNK